MMNNSVKVRVEEVLSNAIDNMSDEFKKIIIKKIMDGDEELSYFIIPILSNVLDYKVKGIGEPDGVIREIAVLNQRLAQLGSARALKMVLDCYAADMDCRETLSICLIHLSGTNIKLEEKTRFIVGMAFVLGIGVPVNHQIAIRLFRDDNFKYSEVLVNFLGHAGDDTVNKQRQAFSKQQSCADYKKSIAELKEQNSQDDETSSLIKFLEEIVNLNLRVDETSINHIIGQCVNMKFTPRVNFQDYQKNFHYKYYAYHDTMVATLISLVEAYRQELKLKDLGPMRPIKSVEHTNSYFERSFKPSHVRGEADFDYEKSSKGKDEDIYFNFKKKKKKSK